MSPSSSPGRSESPFSGSDFSGVDTVEDRGDLQSVTIVRSHHGISAGSLAEYKSPSTDPEPDGSHDPFEFLDPGRIGGTAGFS